MSDTDFVIDLTKGQVIDLTKHAPSVTKFYVGLRWKANFDLDVSAFPCTNETGDPRLISPPYFIFFNNLRSPCGGLIHSPDALDGDGKPDDVDDEFILIDTSKIDSRIDEISIVTTIFGAPQNGQHFGQVQDAQIRICELVGTDQPGRELARYELNNDAGSASAVQFGSLTKSASGWSFEAVGAGFNTDLNGVIQTYMPGAKTKTQ